jgi:hypothetical protein
MRTVKRTSLFARTDVNPLRRLKDESAPYFSTMLRVDKTLLAALTKLGRSPPSEK